MAYLPRHQPQLGRGTLVPGRSRGSRDCGPRTWLMGIDKQTKGAKRPSIRQLRERAQVEGPLPTSVFDAKVAVESYKGLRYRIVRTIAGVKKAVANGKFVHACIHYGEFNEQVWRTGDPFFTGGHSVGICGQKRRRRDGEVMWLLFDPLDDARRSAIPAGPRWVPRRAVVAAMVAFGGSRETVYAGIFGGKAA